MVYFQSWGVDYWFRNVLPKNPDLNYISISTNYGFHFSFAVKEMRMFDEFCLFFNYKAKNKSALEIKKEMKTALTIKKESIESVTSPNKKGGKITRYDLILY